jgi:hypothetical protein
VIVNCRSYYAGKEGCQVYIEQANRLNEVLSQQVAQLERYVKSSRGAADQAKASIPPVLPQPSPALLLSAIQEMRAVTYTDKATRISEPAMGPFEKPVSLTLTDYAQHVKYPMDLQTVDQKIIKGLYTTPEDFEYDVNFIFKNCETYNLTRGGDHLVAMSKFGARQFKKIFYAKMRAFEDPSSVQPAKEERQGAQAESPPSLIKTELSKGKTAPRISITAAMSSAALNVARTKSPSAKKNTSTPAPKPSQPVPLHIAIARVKEAFPLRRAVKSLQPWESACARYFKELMRHPWISAAKPKFIFHVPVPTLFPDLQEVYFKKIRKPMDLTSVECTLLAGNRYAGPEDFVQDVALVFANAIRFNKDGRDIGDPLSCAYYDASVHLLCYSRWLSLEWLSDYVDASSDHTGDANPDGLPPLSWKLTGGNRNRAREEMEKLVLSEPFDKSLEGDRYTTWHEAEADKLLKALRHQSDLRYMTFFIQPNYPADYTAFVSKPMDWEKVQRTLKKRNYDTFGEIIEDLRLIFTNAIKYNSRLKGTDTVSGRAYDAAEYMSAKLEAAISKLMLTVSDRLERERIDHANAEREIEAEERAEEVRIRAAWKKDSENKEEGAAMPPLSSSATMMLLSRPDMTQKSRLVRVASQQRREAMDFEIPFFDDQDDGLHEKSYFEIVKFQKAMFEKQRQDLSTMRQCAGAIGFNVYVRHLQRKLAMDWEDNELKKQGELITNEQGKEDDITASRKDPGSELREPSNVLSQMDQQGRALIHIKLAAPKKVNKRKRTPLLLE